MPVAALFFKQCLKKKLTGGIQVCQKHHWLQIAKKKPTDVWGGYKVAQGKTFKTVIESNKETAWAQRC